MKTEFGIIVACVILASGILMLIANDPNDVISFSSLEKINQDAAKETDQKSLVAYKTKMKRQLQLVTSSGLGMNIDSIYLKEDWNFPFKNSSEVKLQEKYKATPVCDILPNLSSHLQNIRKSEMFSLYGEKYQNYSIELDIADERYYNSTVHYGFAAKSGDKYASTHFHVDSCTGIMSEYFYLRCHDPTLGNATGSNFPREVIASLQSDEFCEIQLEPWRQELAEYNKEISREVEKNLEKIRQQESKHPENMNSITHELHGLNLLGNMVRLVMESNFDETEFEEKRKQYERGYGDVPEKLFELIEKRK